MRAPRCRCRQDPIDPVLIEVLADFAQSLLRRVRSSSASTEAEKELLSTLLKAAAHHAEVDPDSIALVLVADGERHNTRRQTIKTVVDKNMHATAHQVGQASSAVNAIRDSGRGNRSRDASPIRERDSSSASPPGTGKARLTETEREGDGAPPEAGEAAGPPSD